MTSLLLSQLIGFPKNSEVKMLHTLILMDVPKITSFGRCFTELGSGGSEGCRIQGNNRFKIARIVGIQTFGYRPVISQ